MEDNDDRIFKSSEPSSEKKNIINTEEQEKNSEKTKGDLEKERYKWNDIVKGIIQKCSSVSTLTDAEVDMLSYRHMVIDDLAYYRNMVSDFDSIKKNKRRQLEYFYKKKYGMNLKPKELDHFIDDDLKFLTRIIESLEHQVNFLQGVRDTLDKAGYVIKHKYEFQKNY